MKSNQKRAKKWLKIKREVLIPIYTKKGIFSCELKLDDKCTGKAFTGFAHRHERSWYYKKPELLGNFNETLLVCVVCHGKIDRNRELKELQFKQIRETA